MMMNYEAAIAHAKTFIDSQGKKRLGIIAATVLVFLFLLSKCGGTPIGPDTNDLSNSIESEIHSFLKGGSDINYIQAGKTNILASENVGNSVDEIIEGRFTSRVELLEPLYGQVGSLSDKEALDKDYAVIKRLLKAGKKFDLSGKYQATLASSDKSGKTWKTKIYFDHDLKAKLSGFPLERFSVYVMEGSKEHKNIKTKVDEAVEKRRLEKVKFEAKKTAFLKSLAGHWVSEGPLLRSNGKPYYEPKKVMHWDITKPHVEVFCAHPFGAGMEFTVPLMTAKSKEIAGTTYWIHDKAQSKKITGTITINDTYDGFSFQKDANTGDVKCRAVGIKTIRKIRMFPYGTPMFSGKIIGDEMHLNETSYRKTKITMKKVTKESK